MPDPVTGADVRSKLAAGLAAMTAVKLAAKDAAATLYGPQEAPQAPGGSNPHPPAPAP